MVERVGGRHQMNFKRRRHDRRQQARRPGRPSTACNGVSERLEQVTKIRRIVEDLGHQIATPAEARQMLGLKGADRVKF